MPAFAKNPKFIGGTILIVWLAYVLYENFQLAPVEIHLIPFAATLDFRVSAVIIGSMIFGSVLTLTVQFLWNRRKSSKPGDVSAEESAARANTVA